MIVFFVIYGDDIYASSIYQALLASGRSIAGKITDDLMNFGVLRLHDDVTLSDIVEKPNEFIGNLVNVGVYFVDLHLFEFFDDLALSVRRGYELTGVTTRYAQRYPLSVISTQDYWLTIGFPCHILQANDVLMPYLQTDIKGAVEDHIVIRENVIIGEGTLIKFGTHIDGNVIIGKNCVIGPHTYIRGNVDIGDICTIGSSVEKNIRLSVIR